MSLLRRIDRYPNLCTFCKYYKSFPFFTRQKCDVFAHFDKPIPPEIANSRYDHRYPHPEDGGVQFEARTLDEVQQERYFQRYTIEQLQSQFTKLIETLEATHENGVPPTSEGHLPSIWFMYDD